MIEELKKVKSVEIQKDHFIYKGLKFIFGQNGVEILTTDTDFYKHLPECHRVLFDTLSFPLAMEYYLKDKYESKLNVIEDKIKKEINGKNNHNTIAFLKKKRIEYINRYNNAGNIK